MTEPNSPGKDESPQSLALHLKASLSHLIITLIGSAFLCFEFVFLNFYFDSSWFGIELRTFGVPVILAAVPLAHILLCFGESRLACRWASPLLQGKPPVVYRNWIKLDAEGLAFGYKHVRYEAIDELELTLLGNLVLKSRIVCGSSAPAPDKILKFPFSVADFATQEILLEKLRKQRPTLKMNKRLETGRQAILQKGTQATQLVTAGLMVLLLFDVGFSSFYYLDLLKNYYLAETDLRDHKPDEAAKHFASAENLRLHPLPFSWVSGKFLKSSNVASGIWEQRAQVLWLQGKHAEAIESGKSSVAESPTNLRHRLFQTRMLVDDNKISEAKEQLESILKDHKHSLMPRLYLLAIDKDHVAKDKLLQTYKKQLDACYDDIYDHEPHWPPGGDRFFTELFYSDDSRFLLDRYLSTKYEPPAVSEQGKSN